jgi:membrane-associated phospholipid phosphatase
MKRRVYIAFSLMLFLHATCVKAEDSEVSKESLSDYFLKTLPKNLITETTRSFWGWNLVLILAGAGTALVLSQTDIDKKIQDALGDPENIFTEIGYIGGHGITVSGIAALTYTLGRLTSNEKTITTGKALIEAQILTFSVTGITKLSSGRKRPSGDKSRISSSFPSGHASASFALASVIDVMYGHKIGIPLYAFAGFIGFSRIVDNEHFLSDVLFGAVLGTVIGRTAAGFYKKKQNINFSLLPYTTGDNIGLSFAFMW